MHNSTNDFLGRKTALLAAGLLIGLAGCGPSPKAPAGAAAGGAGAPKPPAAGVAAGPVAGTNAVKLTKSEFILDPKKSRDPFYPNSKWNTQVTAAPTNQVAKADLVSMLDFKGSIGSGADRIAFVNDVGLEQGKKATIVLNFEGKEHRLRVECLRINKGSVDLKIEGMPQPVQLKLKR